MSQLPTQVLDKENKLNSWGDARDFHDPETASSSGATHVPSQPREFGVNVFQSLPASRRTILKFLRGFTEDGVVFMLIDIRKHCGTWKSGETRSAQLIFSAHRFDQGLESLTPLYRSGRTYSRHGVMDSQRYPISELHLGKFPDSFKFSKLESQLQD